jgi:YtoQ family protein
VSASETDSTKTTWLVYLSGEIHSAWRDEIVAGAAAAGLPVRFAAPVMDHEASDGCGARILGAEQSSFWNDHKGAGINSIRTLSLIDQANIVVVRFGTNYRQWNAAFEAGYAVARNKPLVTLHDEELDHALKEVDAAARATARAPGQVVEILKYVLV